MHDSNADFSDEVPVADAVEQQYPAADFPGDDDRPGDLPLEATASDWQEQRETVPLDPEEFEQRGRRPVTSGPLMID